MLLAPLCMCLHSCKPEENTPREYPIPQEVLNYFYFKQGSYWVYENDKTGEKDTFVVQQASRAWEDGPKSERYEGATSVQYNKKEQATYTYQVFTQGSAGCIKEGSKWPCYSLNCSKVFPGNVLGDSKSFFYPFKKGYGGQADYSSQKSTITMANYFDSLIVSGTTHRKVMVANITNSLVANRKEVNFYWAENVGIVRKENLTDNQTWNLIYYQIIQ